MNLSSLSQGIGGGNLTDKPSGSARGRPTSNPLFLCVYLMASLSSSSSSFFSSSSSSRTPPSPSPSPPPHFPTHLFSPLRFRSISTSSSRPRHPLLVSCTPASSSFSGDLNSREDASSRSNSKKTFLSDLIQEIEPLDVSLIQRDVPPTTIDAMKRTISGMLGLLPSNQFQVHVEALWESLSKLLISSMMTGYTLRNAEYRLCLERNLDIHEEDIQHDQTKAAKFDVSGMLLDSVRTIQSPDENGVSSKSGEDGENQSDDLNPPDFGEMTPEEQSYILDLQSRLSSIKKELHEVKRKNAALQMQQFVGEEKNDLLDYLRSLHPEKVAELSQPTSPELRETIQSVVHGLLATLSPRMHTKPPPHSEKNTATLNVGNEEYAELTENSFLPFKPMISLTRDYLARLLFWCMLLGHYLRGLEYRMQLKDLLSLSSENVDDTLDGEQSV